MKYYSESVFTRLLLGASNTRVVTPLGGAGQSLPVALNVKHDDVIAALNHERLNVRCVLRYIGNLAGRDTVSRENTHR